MRQTPVLIDKWFRYSVLVCSLLCATAINKTLAQAPSIIKRGNFGDFQSIFFIDSLWYVHAGELPGENQPVTGITGWDTLRHTDFGKADRPKGWNGYGWFAIRVAVDSELVDKKLALRMNQDGASDIFVDGRPVGSFGKPAANAQEMEASCARRDIIPLWFADTRPHLLSIHYSNFDGPYPDFLGFQLSIGDFEKLSARMDRYNLLFSYMPMFAAAQIILALLHFFLYLFYPRQKLNLYYTLFVLLIGINCVAIYLYYQSKIPNVQYFCDFLTFEFKVLIMWTGVQLLYALNYTHIPRWRTLTLAAVSVFYLVVYLFKFFIYPLYQGTDYFTIVFLIFGSDGLWSAFQVIRRKQKGAWLIGAGVIAVILVYFFAWADVFHLWPYQYNALRVFALGAGQLLLPLCLSIYLALDFAHTNRDLAAKLSEVERLSARALAQEMEKRELLAGEAKRLEEIVQQRTAELVDQADKLLEMDTVKSRFFTNITHEFKTPLTLIMNPAKDLLSASGNKTDQQQLQLIINNANRLLQLINQLLDLSKLENGLMELSPSALNLAALVQSHIQSYESLARQKNIELLFEQDWGEWWIQGDRDKLEKIIQNVLSNAMKFTDKGQVKVTLHKEAGANLLLTVRDTGTGIPAAKLPYIFEQFYQADPSDTRSAEGTGIGLALTKELVAIMGGQVTATSGEGLFTEISIRLPYAPATPRKEAVLQLSDNLLLTDEDSNQATGGKDEKPMVLLIDDHVEMRQFIQQSLSIKYRVITAADGNEGIALALEQVPNLVITDLMMPRTDGYAVSNALKKDLKTSHIPIIILTAKSGTDNRILGIEKGADAYLEKPFDKRELFALIDNLINTRHQLRQHYSKGDTWLSETASMPSIEQDFITRVRAVVEKHLDDEGFSAEQLAREMGLSRTQLHRKLKALIDQAPGELIRVVRLQHAHDLLQRQVATVAEVAYKVGFSNPASFSASFSRHFGFPPSKLPGK